MSMPDPRQNHLLAALPADAYARIAPALELIHAPFGYSLLEPGTSTGYAWFPIDAIVSLLCVMEDGASTQIAVVGHEGFVGVALCMGGETTSWRGMVHSAGHAYRLNGQILKNEFHCAGATQHLLLRYTQALLTQMAQSAVCNRRHSLSQRFCRWLLTNLDKLPSNDLIITQEVIANLLGVRREGVTDAASKLQRAGLINYHRGHISVLDRSGLETQACECYALVKQEYERLLPRGSTIISRAG